MFNASRPSDTVIAGQPEEEIFARPVDSRMPKGWLVDMINRFGQRNGFQILLERFQKNLSVIIIAALIKPFGYCYEVLTVNTVQKYFLPIIEIVSVFLENLTDDELIRSQKPSPKTTLCPELSTPSSALHPVSRNRRIKLRILNCFVLKSF
jgi:ubiquitin carboxyl-terminal hydrolase 9/24